MWGEFFISDKKEKKIFNLIKLHKHTLAFIKISVKLLKCRDRGEWNKGRALTYKIIFNTVYRVCLDYGLHYFLSWESDSCPREQTIEYNQEKLQ